MIKRIRVRNHLINYMFKNSIFINPIIVIYTWDRFDQCKACSPSHTSW